MFPKSVLFFTSCLTIIITTSFALNCYQCNGTDSTHPFQCNELLKKSDIDLIPEPCDGVYGAKYCIKHVGRHEGNSLRCYQCSSANNTDCSDLTIFMGGIEAKSCDHVYNAQYCIKTRSLNGGIGTQRYCSSVDKGNYCNYVRQPGDTLTYRSCVYTCTGDGCNSAKKSNLNLKLLILGVIFKVLTFLFS